MSNLKYKTRGRYDLIKNELRKDGKNMKSMSRVDEIFNEYFAESNTSDKVPDNIEDSVKVLESKGYNVKYASPGYVNSPFTRDANKDGILNGKFVSTARVIFERDYHFSSTPQGWTWKVLDNGSKALYVKPHSYDYDKADDKEKQFVEWQAWYLTSLYDWAKSISNRGDDNKEGTTPDTEFKSS